MLETSCWLVNVSGGETQSPHPLTPVVVDRDKGFQARKRLTPALSTSSRKGDDRILVWDSIWKAKLGNESQELINK